MRRNKKLIAAAALALCAALALPVCGLAAKIRFEDTGVQVRDPYVLEYEGVYYMYGTGLAWDGYGCVYGTDLKNWSAPVRVYSPEGACDGTGDWWAPECHYYKGAFYLFASYRSAATDKRGVGIFRAESPLGPFALITDGHVTPKNHDAIDGTLYVDGDGQPWMIYVSEWTSNPDGIGDMMAAKLSDDLTAFISEPTLLFRASDGGWNSGHVTDGPFLYRTKNGRLLMLWSNMNSNGYYVNVAWSADGRPDGKWRQQPGKLYEATKYNADGGHGMLFTGPDGTLTLAVHSPNVADAEHPTTAIFVPVADTGDTLVTADRDNPLVRTFYRVYFSLIRFADLFSGLRTGLGGMKNF